MKVSPHAGKPAEPAMLVNVPKLITVPALASALEVLAANGVNVMMALGDEYTPTPAVSHAILTYNRGRKTGLADGIVITPSIVNDALAAVPRRSGLLAKTNSKEDL